MMRRGRSRSGDVTTTKNVRTHRLVIEKVVNAVPGGMALVTRIVVGFEVNLAMFTPA
jgi:hypothetical protein